jgi:arginyl-tRNA synthetase
MEKFRKLLTECLQSRWPDWEPAFTEPPTPDAGDLALPCFALAKTIGREPRVVAAEIADSLRKLDFIERLEPVNGYLNIHLNKRHLAEAVLEAIATQGRLYGASGSGAGKTALIEHSSINPNASPHVGRARNALIGDCLVRLLRFEGYRVEVRYFVNDIGKQIAMLLLGTMDRETVDFRDLLQIYVEINQKIAADPRLEQEVFELLNRLEAGDESIRKAFRQLVEICVRGQTAILSELGIGYDRFDYESDYVFDRITAELLDAFRGTGRLEEDGEGRSVLNLAEFQLPLRAPYLVLTRGDGTSLYPLRDIAYTIDKLKEGADLNLIVLGEDQKLYFRQIGAALELLGYSAPKAVHYSFVLVAEGKMATRKGNVVLLEEFMKEAKAKAAAEIEKRRGRSDERTAAAIGYGAVKYAMLKASNDKNLVFDWETALSFDGDSGPYLQYSLARINSILRNYGKPLPGRIDYHLLGDEAEIELLRELARFPDIVATAVRELSPHFIAGYLYRLAKKFSAFYHQCPVLNAANESLTQARLGLIGAVRQVLRNGFGLLGIAAIDVM